MANRETLQRMSKGMRGQVAASQVDDMGGAARVGALLLGTTDEDELLHWAEAVCTVTHVNSLAVSAAQFVALSAYRVAHLEEVKQVFSGAAA
jgi:ADP-ribosylglycohydrolase